MGLKEATKPVNADISLLEKKSLFPVTYCINTKFLCFFSSDVMIDI